MLTVSTWFWGDKYSNGDVEKLAAGVRRNLNQPHKFVCFSEHPLGLQHVEYSPIKDMHLTEIQGCFARIRMFDPEVQKSIGMEPGDRLLNIDLDTVITGPLDPVIDRPEPFVILQGGNAANPCPFCGAVMMLRAGANPEIWSDFSLDAASRIRRYQFADDQGWLWHKFKTAPAWMVGLQSGIYVFQKPGWPFRDDGVLPPNARIVTFNGWRMPKAFTHLRWVRECWGP